MLNSRSWNQHILDFFEWTTARINELLKLLWINTPLIVAIMNTVLSCSWIFINIIFLLCVFPSTLTAPEFYQPNWIIRTIRSFISSGYPFTWAQVLDKTRDHRAVPRRKLVQYHTTLHATEEEKAVSLSVCLLSVCVLLFSLSHKSYSRTLGVLFSRMCDITNWPRLFPF